jgi:DNA-binding NarL/FixJ family response regulator
MNGHGPSAAELVRISLMCESPIVYQTLGPRLGADRTLDVVSSHDCTIDEVPTALAYHPHVVILGISRITHFNMIIVQALRQTAPQVRIIMLPSYVDTPDDISQAHTAGPMYARKRDTPTWSACEPTAWPSTYHLYYGPYASRL